MFRIPRKVALSTIRISSRYFTTVKSPSQVETLLAAMAKNRSVLISNAGNSRLSFVNSAWCRAYSYSTEGGIEKTQEAQSSRSANESRQTSRSRQPSNSDKRILVWTGKYKTVDEVPEFVSEAALLAAKSKFRIYINVGMGVITLIAAIVMIVIGKSRSKKGESISKLNLERHPERFGK